MEKRFIETGRRYRGGSTGVGRRAITSPEATIGSWRQRHRWGLRLGGGALAATVGIACVVGHDQPEANAAGRNLVVENASGGIITVCEGATQATKCDDATPLTSGETSWQAGATDISGVIIPPHSKIIKYNFDAKQWLDSTSNCQGKKPKVASGAGLAFGGYRKFGSPTTLAKIKVQTCPAYTDPGDVEQKTDKKQQTTTNTTNTTKRFDIGEWFKSLSQPKTSKKSKHKTSNPFGDVCAGNRDVWPCN